MFFSQEKWEREEGANDTKQLLMQRDFELQMKKDECTKLQAQLQALKDATPHKRSLSFASQGRFFWLKIMMAATCAFLLFV